MIERIDTEVAQKFIDNYSLSNKNIIWNKTSFQLLLSGKPSDDNLIMEFAEKHLGTLDLILHFSSDPLTYYMLDNQNLDTLTQSEHDIYVNNYLSNLYTTFNTLAPNNTRGFSIKVFQANLFASIIPAPFDRIITNYARVDTAMLVNCPDPVTVQFFQDLNNRIVKIVHCQDQSGNNWEQSGSIVCYDLDTICPPTCS